MRRSWAFYFGIYCLLCALLGSLILTLTRAEEDDIFGSLDASAVTEPTSEEVKLKCYTSGMCVHLDKEWLRTQVGVASKSQLMLRQRCDSSLEDTETHFILCTQKGRLTSCGSEYVQNETHVSFSNNVHILLPLRPDAVPTVRASIPWTCTYPMKILVGFNVVPQISPVTIFLGNKTGYGEFEASMLLYEDEKFQKAYENVPRLHITDRLRVKVELFRGPITSRIQVVKCWGTPYLGPEDGDPTFTLIDDYCPSVQSTRADVKLRNNGDLQHVLWESNVFRFVSSPEVYIHCNVKVCFGGAKCEKKCTSDEDARRRKRREVGNEPGTGLLSLGPLSIADDVPKMSPSFQEPELEENATAPSPDNIEESTILGMPKLAVFGMFGALAAVFLSLGVGVCAGIYRRKRQRNREKYEAFWKAQAAARCRLANRFTLSNTPFEIPMSVPNTIAFPVRRDNAKTQH